MHGQGFQVQHLLAVTLQGMQQAALARAGGAADNLEPQRGRQAGQIGQHLMAIAFVAAFQLVGVPADLAEDDGHRCRTLATAPAVDQRLPGFWPGMEMLLQVPGDILRHQRGAQLACFERADLLVEGAHADTFFVIQHRAIDGARQVIFGEFGWRAHVDDLVKLGQL